MLQRAVPAPANVTGGGEHNEMYYYIGIGGVTLLITIWQIHDFVMFFAEPGASLESLGAGGRDAAGAKAR